ncbi:UcrQ family protein [Colletotrichum truncatum]|uniref:UcrQ family protein n=1 Tax=Colletotrichum truncatum TaxID=5467 RepID=A0ACC3Z536_COLTU|nr:UcrQ family protein [Colletotrichum truncatum]KAF6795082.1 UcrQ family protein [Colletotrichum truncatum]
MRPTQSLQSGPHVPVGRYGVVLKAESQPGGQKQRGIITYGIAPNRLNPLAGAAHNAIFNVWRRFASQVWYFAPPMVAGWYVMYWADER